MRSKPPSCSGCAICDHGTDFSAIEGTGANGVMLVGEASGQMEARDQLPFRPYAPAGSVLERCLRRMGLDRQAFSVTNVVRCFPAGTLVSARGVNKVFKRWYEGDLVTVSSISGILTGTPNHPVLTQRGWIGLGFLVKGDYLVCCHGTQWVGCRDPHIDYTATRIEEVFDSLANFAVGQRIIGTDMDFHGDGSASEIQIVSSNRFLLYDPYATAFKHVAEDILEPANAMSPKLIRNGSGLSSMLNLVARKSRPTSSLMRCFSDLCYMTGAEPMESCFHGFRPAARCYPAPEQFLSGRIPVSPKLQSYGFESIPTQESFDEIVSVERARFAGHVYNLHTEDDIYVASNYIVHNCRPRNDSLENAPWEYAAIRQCRPNLDTAIRERRPRVIVALGGTAFRELTGVAGEAQGVTHMAGYMLPKVTFRGEEWSGTSTGEPTTIPVIANFHPSYLRRGKASHQGVFSRILKRALDIAKGLDREWMWNVDPDDCSTWNTPSGGKLNYWLKPSLEQCWSVLHYLKDNPNLTVAKDLETYESASIDEDAREGFQDTEIRQFQLSYQPGTGIAIPYDGPFKTVIREFLGLPNPFYGHNWDNFDHKVCRAAASREGWKYAPPVRCFDTLDMFHHGQPDLPAHLQFCASFIRWPFPWKHLAGTNIEFYGICDVDSDLQLGHFLVQMLKKDGLWDDQNYRKVVLGKDTNIPVPSVIDNGHIAIEPALSTSSSPASLVEEPTTDRIRGYLGQVRDLRPVLAAMEDRGVPIDNARRLKLGEDFRIAADKIAQELMPLFPESAKKLEPYKKLPPELKKLKDKGVPEEEWTQLFREEDRWKCKCGRSNNRMEDSQCTCGRGQEDGSVKPGKWYRYDLREVEDVGGRGELSSLEQSTTDIALDESKITSPPLSNERPPTKSVRWCYIPEFNPNSRPMVIAYMRAKGHVVPKSKEEDWEGNQKETTASKELQRLAVKTGDTFYLGVVEYRGLSKMQGTYVDGFKPSADGCVHTTFTFLTAIGQLASRNPNTTNFPKLKPTPELAKAMREMIAPKPGMVITEWDYKSCHALTLGYLAESQRYMRMARLDIHSFVAGHFLNLWDARLIEKESDAELMARFKWLKSDPERKRIRDDQAKHCIAEGQLVLTDGGLIPIEEISLEHRLWDGVEWVEHEGLIYQGMREVMTHDGLTATPDHLVFIEDGSSTTLREAALGMERLLTTGIEGQAVRASRCDLIENTARQRIHNFACAMHDLQKEEVDSEGQFEEASRMPVLFPEEVYSPDCSRETLRRDHSEMQQSTYQRVQMVRWAWDKVPVPIPQRLCAVRYQGTSSQGLQGSNHRPQGQQRSLRARESQAGLAVGANQQSTQYLLADVERSPDPWISVLQSVHSILDMETSEEGGAERGANPRQVRRVYDIANAGPRRCFTVSGKLVFNSILGIGNGLRAKGLHDQYMEQFPARPCPECTTVTTVGDPMIMPKFGAIGMVKGIRGLKKCPLCDGRSLQSGLSIAFQFEQILREVLFPEVFTWQDRVQMEAHEKRQLVTEFGHIRRFYEVKRWDHKMNKGRGGWGHGDQAEESIAYWLANIAFSHIREAMKELDRRGLAEKYGLFNNVHDSFMFHFPQGLLEEHRREIAPVLLAPSKILTNPKVAPGGLVIDVEGSWTDRDWAHMKDLFEPEPPKVTYDGGKFTYLEEIAHVQY